MITLLFRVLLGVFGSRPAMSSHELITSAEGLTTVEWDRGSGGRGGGGGGGGGAFNGGVWV